MKKKTPSFSSTRTSRAFEALTIFFESKKKSSVTEARVPRARAQDFYSENKIAEGAVVSERASERTFCTPLLYWKVPRVMIYWGREFWSSRERHATFSWRPRLPKHTQFREECERKILRSEWMTLWRFMVAGVWPSSDHKTSLLVAVSFIHDFSRLHERHCLPLSSVPTFRLSYLRSESAPSGLVRRTAFPALRSSENVYDPNFITKNPWNVLSLWRGLFTCARLYIMPRGTPTFVRARWSLAHASETREGRSCPSQKDSSLRALNFSLRSHTTRKWRETLYKKFSPSESGGLYKF